MPIATSGAARIAYDVHGDGPAVLLVHAGVTDRRSWAPLVDALDGRFRTIAYDQRGYGETTYEPGPHSAVDDALAVLDAEGVDRAIVIGASNGGRRSIHLALDHPGRVRALVLISAGLRGGPDDDLDSFSADVRALYDAYEAAEESGDLEELNRIEAHAWLDGWSAVEGRVQGPARELFLEMNHVALHAEDPGEDGTGAAWDRVGEIAAPTLVLLGDLDVVCQPASQHFAAMVPGARFELLEGTGHLPHLEGHKRCLRLIRAFLDEVSA